MTGDFPRGLFALILIALALAGCGDAEEISSLSNVAAIGIDQGSEPGLIRVSIQISVPAGDSATGDGSPSSSRLRILTAEDKSLQSALAKMHGQARRRLFFSHINFFVFGAGYAQSGVAGITEAALQWHNIRGSTQTFVARGTAEEILRAHSGIGKSPGDDVLDLVRKAATAPAAKTTTINDMATALSHGKSSCLSLPILNLTPLALSSGDETPPTGVGQGQEQFMEVFLDGTALFLQDRWVSEISPRETQTLAALLGQAKMGLSVMTNPGNPAGNITLKYESIRVTYKVSEERDGTLLVNIVPIIKMRLEEVSGGYDFDVEGVDPIVMAARNDVRQRVLDLALSLQEQGLDSIDIALIVERHKPQVWRKVQSNWPEVYRALRFDCQPQVMLQTTGLTKNFKRYGS